MFVIAYQTIFSTRVLVLVFQTRTPLKNTLRTNDIPSPNLPLSTPRASRPHRNSQCLKCTFRPMVVIIPIRASDMQRDIGRLRKTVQPMCDHLRAQIADLFAPETDIDHGPGTRGEVDDSP